jgi:uncharacterized protein (DUF885 family)
MKIDRRSFSKKCFQALLVTGVCSVDPGILVGNALRRKNDQGGAETDFAKLREQLTTKILKFEPEESRIQGDSTAAGQLKDWSPRAIAEEVEFCRNGIKQLEAVQVANPAEQIDREVLKAHLTYLEHYYGQYHGELGNLPISVYPYNVIQYELQRFLTSKPDQAAASARDHFNAVEEILRKLPRHLEQQETNLTAGLKRRKPDKEILQKLISDIGSADKPESIRGGFLLTLPLQLKEIEYLPASQKKALHELLQQAAAAYARHADFLNRVLLPQASDSWTLGKDEYRRRFTLIYGDRISLDDLVREAEAKVVEVKKEMTSLAHQLRPELPLSETLAELYKQHSATAEELLRAYEQAQKKIDAGLTSRLGLQTGEVSYVPAPSGVSVGLATNWPAPLRAQGVGIVLVETSPDGLKENHTADLPWIAAHEGNPGHAAQSLGFQKAFMKGQAPLCRFMNVPDEVGYVRGNWYAMANIEGWAFYVERLLLKSGMLMPEEQLAALTGQALRAARVVVDMRMHTAGWSRDDGKEYLMQVAGQIKEVAYRESRRYPRIPLQALSYYLGAGQFEKLDKAYRNRLGEGFYQRLLSLGPVPPTLIDDYFKATMK